MSCADGEGSIEALRIKERGFTGAIAYVAVYEAEDRGRTEPGWYLGIAEEHEAGYWQTTWPRYTETEARKLAIQMNERLGLTSKRVALIVASTMRSTGPRVRARLDYRESDRRAPAEVLSWTRDRSAEQATARADRARAPYPWCRGNPTVQDCITAGYCRRDPNCGE